VRSDEEMRFFALWWWRGFLHCRNFGYGLWRNVWCWTRGYHGNVWWHNAAGLEPDMRCRDCGENLG